MIFLVGYIGICILVLLVSETRNIVTRILFSSWLENLFSQCNLPVFHLQWQLLKYISWLTTKGITCVNNNNENKAFMCDKNACKRHKEQAVVYHTFYCKVLYCLHVLLGCIQVTSFDCQTKWAEDVMCNKAGLHWMSYQLDRWMHYAQGRNLKEKRH